MHSFACYTYSGISFVLAKANVQTFCSESGRGNQLRRMDVHLSAYLRVKGVSEDLTQFLSVHLWFPRLSGVQHRGFNSPWQRAPKEFWRELHCPKREEDQSVTGEINKDTTHPDLGRSLTLQRCRRLQTRNTYTPLSPVTPFQFTSRSICIINMSNVILFQCSTNVKTFIIKYNNTATPWNIFSLILKLWHTE